MDQTWMLLIRNQVHFHDMADWVPNYPGLGHPYTRIHANKGDRRCSFNGALWNSRLGLSKLLSNSS